MPKLRSCHILPVPVFTGAIALLLMAIAGTATAQEQFRLLPFERGTSLRVGDTLAIRWSEPGDADVIRLWYSTDNGEHWRMIDEVSPQAGFDWVVPMVAITPRLMIRADRIRRRHDRVLIAGDGGVSNFDDLGLNVATACGRDTITRGIVRRNRLWDVRSGRMLREYPIPRGPNPSGDAMIGSAAISPDRTRVLFTSYDRGQMYSIPEDRMLWNEWGCGGAVRFTRDGEKIFGSVYADAHGGLGMMRRASDASRISEFTFQHSGAITDVSMSDDRVILAFVGSGEVVTIDVTTDEVKRAGCRAYALSPNSGGNTLAFEGPALIYPDYAIRALEGWALNLISIGNSLKYTHSIGVRYTDDGSRVLLAQDGGVAVYHAENGRLLAEIPCGISVTDHLEISRDNRSIAVSNGDSTAIVGYEDSLGMALAPGTLEVARPDLRTTDLDFGLVDYVNLPAAPTAEFTIENHSGVAVQVLRVQMVDADSMHFSIGYFGQGDLLRPGSAFRVPVTYRPLAGGTHRTRCLVFTLNDTLHATITAASTAAPLWPIEPRSDWLLADFCGTPTVDTFAVATNTDSDTRVARARIVDVSGAGTLRLLDSVIVLAPGDVLRLPVEFTGGNPGVATQAIVEISYGDPASVLTYRLQAVCYNGPATESVSGARASAVLTADVTPNPVRTDALVRYRLARGGVVVVSVYDAAGRELQRRDLGWREAGEGTASIDAASLPNGRFTVRVAAGGDQFALPLVVVR